MKELFWAFIGSLVGVGVTVAILIILPTGIPTRPLLLGGAAFILLNTLVMTLFLKLLSRRIKKFTAPEEPATPEVSVASEDLSVPANGTDRVGPTAPDGSSAPERKDR